MSNYREVSITKPGSIRVVDGILAEHNPAGYTVVKDTDIDGLRVYLVDINGEDIPATFILPDTYKWDNDRFREITMSLHRALTHHVLRR